VDIANVVATSLKANGVDVKVDPRDWSYIRGNWANIDLFVLGWGSQYDPDDHTFKIFHSSQVLDKGGSNLGSYVNPKVDELLQQGRTTLDEAQRKQVYREFQKELNADPPYLWGVYLHAIYGVSKKFQGPQQVLLGHHGIGFFWNVEEWSLK
jgi:peptide/nickel transport system substrate-binding protein